MSKFEKSSEIDSSPHLTYQSEIGIALHGGGRFIDSQLGNEERFLWSGFLPISKSPEPSNVVFSVESVLGEDEIGSHPIVKLINSTPDFDHERNLICKYFHKNKQVIDDLKKVASLNIKANHQALTPNPKPEKHDPGNIYLRSELVGSGNVSIMSYWSFNLLNGKFSLTDFLIPGHKIRYTNHSYVLPLILKLIPAPDLASLNHDLVEISLSINEIDNNIQMNFAVDDNVKIDYRDSGKNADIFHKVKLERTSIIFTWGAKRVSSGDWNIEFTGAGVLSPGGSKSPKLQHLKSDELEELDYAVPGDVLDFSKQQCIDTLLLNHNYSQDELVSHTLNQLAKHKDNVEHEYRILGSFYDFLDVNCQVAHTIHIRDRYVRVFWNVSMKLEHGFMAWPKANFQFKQIRISGIKFIYYSDSEGFDELIKILGDDFLNNSEELTRKAMILENEPFYRYVVGEV